MLLPMYVPVRSPLKKQVASPQDMNLMKSAKNKSVEVGMFQMKIFYLWMILVLHRDH